MDPNGIHWNPMESNGIQWNSMESNGIQWNSPPAPGRVYSRKGIPHGPNPSPGRPGRENLPGASEKRAEKELAKKCLTGHEIRKKGPRVRRPGGMRVASLQPNEAFPALQAGLAAKPLSEAKHCANAPSRGCAVLSPQSGRHGAAPEGR